MKTISVKAVGGAAYYDGKVLEATTEMTREEMKALGEALVEASKTGSAEEGAVVVRAKGRGRRYPPDKEEFDAAPLDFYLSEERSDA